MKTQKNSTAFVWAIFIALLLVPPSAIANVGTKKLLLHHSGKTLHVRLYYPTDAASPEFAFGPYRLKAKPSAVIKNGRYPLVMISHGLTGRIFNHHLTAIALAQNAIIAAEIQHTFDEDWTGSAADWHKRTDEFIFALDAILQEPSFAPHIDHDRLGGYGFSLGGFTVLHAAGGQFDMNRIQQHCVENNARDSEFCQEGRSSAEPLATIENSDQSPLHHLRAIALAAPVGVHFDNLHNVKDTEILLIRAGQDQILQFPFHAENIHQLLPDEHRYDIAEEAHHFAFIAPFPEYIAAMVGEPAQDPEGFDRVEFQDHINKDIVQFFKRALQ